MYNENVEIETVQSVFDYLARQHCDTLVDPAHIRDLLEANGLKVTEWPDCVTEINDTVLIEWTTYYTTERMIENRPRPWANGIHLYNLAYNLYSMYFQESPSNLEGYKQPETDGPKILFQWSYQEEYARLLKQWQLQLSKRKRPLFHLFSDKGNA